MSIFLNITHLKTLNNFLNNLGVLRQHLEYLEEQKTRVLIF